MRARVTFFDITTGLSNGAGYEGPEADLEANTPPGHAALPAVERPHLWRLQDGALVPHVPPSPGADHEWDEAAGEWRLTAAAAVRAGKRRSALARIEDLERAQARAMREHAIGRGGSPGQLKKRLEDIDDAITELRKDLT
jgi:hypothetical protein